MSKDIDSDSIILGTEKFLTFTPIVVIIALAVTSFLSQFEGTFLDFPTNLIFLIPAWLMSIAFFDAVSRTHAPNEKQMLGIRLFFTLFLYLTSLIGLVITPIVTGFMDRFENTYLDFPYSFGWFVLGAILLSVLTLLYDKYQTQMDELKVAIRNDFLSRINRRYGTMFRDGYFFGNSHMTCFLDPKNQKILFRQSTSGFELLLPFNDIYSCHTDWIENSENGRVWYTDCKVVFRLKNYNNPIISIPMPSRISAEEWMIRVGTVINRD